MKYIVNVSLLVVLASSRMVDAFVLQSPTVLISPSRGGPRHHDSTYSRSEDTSTTTTDTSDKIVDALNKEGFLLDMDRSIAELAKHQEMLLRSQGSNHRMTKEEQLARQYKPFARLARKAAQLKAQYTNEIRDIRSSSKTKPTTGLTQPTKSLATFGAVLLGATTLAVMMTSSSASAGMDTFVASLASFTTDFSSVVKVPFVEPSSSPVEESVVAPTTTLETTASYAWRDFSKFDIYGSSADVTKWFSNH
eukprot:scaffold2363_cov159-Amphora_coffeaeformis.AAC.40